MLSARSEQIWEYSDEGNRGDHDDSDRHADGHWNRDAV